MNRVQWGLGQAYDCGAIAGGTILTNVLSLPIVSE